MKADIVEKLRRHLGQSIERELDVVYPLVEIRKILESMGRNCRYASLRLHCNWGLHTTLGHIGPRASGES